MENHDIAGQTSNGNDLQVPSQQESKCFRIAAKGVTTGSDFAQMMSALMSDLIEGNISPIVANATVNAGGKLLKVVELQLKYGRKISLIESNQ